MFPTDFRCPSCQAPMDAFGDHALLCSSDSRSGGFQLRHSLVQRSLGIILRQAGVYHLVEPPHLRLERDDALASGRGSGLTRPVDILLFSWRRDRRCCVDLVGVSPVHSSLLTRALYNLLAEDSFTHATIMSYHHFLNIRTLKTSKRTPLYPKLNLNATLPSSTLYSELQ